MATTEDLGETHPAVIEYFEAVDGQFRVVRAAIVNSDAMSVQQKQANLNAVVVGLVRRAATIVLGEVLAKEQLDMIARDALLELHSTLQIALAGGQHMIAGDPKIKRNRRKA